MGTNCLFFAIALGFRRRRTHYRMKVKRRCYIALRWSDSGLFPHFLYCEELPYSGIRRISYKPTHPVPHVFPPLLFRGAVRWGDEIHHIDEGT